MMVAVSQSRKPSRGRIAVVRHGEFYQPHPRRDLVALRDAGFEVDYICDAEDGKPTLERIDGINVIRMPLRHKRGGLGRYIFEYTAAPLLAGGALTVRSLRRRYDYVEIDTMPTWLIAAAVVPKLLGSSVVLYMFEHMAELTATDRNLDEDNLLIRLIDAVEMVCIRAADRVLTPAERNRELYIERGIDPDKIVFIPNCPDENLFLAGLNGHDRRKASDAQKEFRLVTHGSLLERYGIQLLLEAVASLRADIPEIRLDVIGSGEYEPSLKAKSRALGLDEFVTFGGPIPFEQLAARLIEADLGVAPYLLDLLPNKLMECFLLGIPAIASDWPTMRRYFGDDAVTYVPPNDVGALAAAIYDLYQHPTKRSRQAKAAQKQFLSTLAWSRTRHDYLGVYGVEPGLIVSEETAAKPGSRGWIPFVLGQSRGPKNAAKRLPTILHRFGLSAAKSIKNFEQVLAVTDRHSVTPTLPVTAVTAKRHPNVVNWLRDRGVELALHGYVHNDYSALSATEQLIQIQRARTEMTSLGFPVRGWRCPYSRWNPETIKALNATGFEYDATPVYEWPAFQQEGIHLGADEQADYDRLCRLFNVRDAATRAVLPELVEGLTQIPMSIPQDEDMVDRLHLGTGDISRVWLRVLRDSHCHGEVFAICLHPERARFCAEPLDATLTEARRLGNVWIAPLGDISDWWKERAQARVELHSTGDGSWKVATNASSRVSTTFANLRLEGTGSAEIDSAHKPAAYASSAWPVSTLNRIIEAGFVVEGNGAGPAGYTVDLDQEFSPADDAEVVVRALQSRGHELVRIQPWPDNFASCLSITGDIDALTLFDFAMRLKEFS